MSGQKEILLGNINACKQRIEKLTYSLGYLKQRADKMISPMIVQACLC